MRAGVHGGLLLALALLPALVLPSPAWANYQAPQVAVRVDGDPSIGLFEAAVQAVSSRPRFRHWPIGPSGGDPSAWLNQARAAARSLPAGTKAYGLLLRLTRGPMHLGTPKEETREPSRGRTEVWLVGSIEQELTARVEFVDLTDGPAPLAPFSVTETMRRRFEVEITKLNALERSARGVELGLRMGREMRRPPNEVFAGVLGEAARSLAQSAFQRVAALDRFQLHAEVNAFDANRDRATIPLGSDLGLKVGDSFAWQQANGQRSGHFRVQALGPQSSELQPIFWSGAVPQGLKLVESGRGGSWISALGGIAYFGAPMVGGGLRYSGEASRIWGKTDGYFILEGSGYLGAGAQAGWGGVGFGGRSFLRATSLGWRAVGGAMMASPLTGTQVVPAAALGLSLERMLAPGFSVGLDLSPVVGWPIQRPGSTQAQLPLGGSAQLGVHLIF